MAVDDGISSLDEVHKPLLIEDTFSQLDNELVFYISFPTLRRAFDQHVSERIWVRTTRPSQKIEMNNHQKIIEVGPTLG